MSLATMAAQLRTPASCAAPAPIRSRGVVACSAAEGGAAPRRLLHKAQSLAAATVIATGLVAAPALAVGVDFAAPKAGAKLTGPVHFEFKVDGKVVRPAADGLDEDSGHFHLIIDDNTLYEEGRAIPFDDTHLHYGKAQTSADVKLAPGKHTVYLQFANAVHQSYGPKFAKTITVEVAE